MATVRVLVLRAPGINCDEETAFAWESAGAKAERIHVRRVIERPSLLGEYQIVTLPGGFSYGDDIASGRILAVQISHRLTGRLAEFVHRGGLLLGICNGFQVLVRAGLLPGAGCPVAVTLAGNDSGRYEDRWVRVRVEADHCPFLRRGELFDVPVAHGEGKVLPEGGEAGRAALEASGHIAFRYISREAGEPVYPENPNGSIGNAAGLVDATGRILGLMPHPERSLSRWQAPDWIRDIHTETGGHRFFERAVGFMA
jgi:phosphoribosylformylglycinamidine synthase